MKWIEDTLDKLDTCCKLDFKNSLGDDDEMPTMPFSPQ